MREQPDSMLVPVLLAPDAFAVFIGLPRGVVAEQVRNRYWPTVKVGKRLLVNVEAVRAAARSVDHAGFSF